MPTILDFHIRPQEVVSLPRGAMSQALDETYCLEVFARSNTQPLATATFDYPLFFITEFELNRLDVNPNDPVGRFERLREFGAILYAKLFTPEMQQIWQQHKDRTDFFILCLRIAPEAAGLEALPWETLFDGEEFLAAGAKTGLSRLPLDIPPQDDLPPLPPPRKMLAFISSPLDLSDDERLQIEREQEILLQAVNTPAGQGRLQVDFEDEAKLPILENSLEAGYHILHFAGHGMLMQDGGALLLEDAEGKRRPTAVAEILQSLQRAEGTLRLAVISGCQTARTKHIAGFQDIARGLTRRRIPAVVAMQFSITDQGGLQFAELLYAKLASGQSLEMALSATRRGLLQSDDPYCFLQADALAPVLFSANGECLKTDRSLAVTGQSEPKINFNFHLPLPQLSFGFYGRRREYRQIRDGLLHQDYRVIIVHGIGGIGKTALASHAATRLRDYFKGVYAFDCSSGTLASERIVLELHRYFERLGVMALQPLVHQSLPPEELATYLAQALSQWPLLLIFDNFESQLTNSDLGFRIADDNLRTFLNILVKTTATSSRFLLTSRYLFDLDVKRLGNIPELPLGDLSRPEALGLMQKLPHLSAASFEEKLKAFETFGGHPYALVALDHHCGYRPLSEVLQDASTVHAELREFLAIELNYAKLSDCSRELLNRLAAFRQPMPPKAAEWVMGEPESGAEAVAQGLLQRLDRKKLPKEYQAIDETELLLLFQKMLPEQRRVENLDQPIAELISWGLLTPIYEDGQLETLAVHSLVRDFCRDKQKDEIWRTRLCEASVFYINRTKLLSQDEKPLPLVWGEMEAFELLMEAEDWQDATNLLYGTQALLIRWGFGRYLESQYRRLLEKVDRATAAKIGHNLGVLLEDRGDYVVALTMYEKARNILEELGDRAGVTKPLHQIGIIHQRRGNYSAALAEYEKALKIAGEFDDHVQVAICLHQIGMIYQYRGEHAAALVKYEKALKIKEELGDRAGMARSLRQIGMIHHDRGDYSAALVEYEKALKIMEELGDRVGIASSLHTIGNTHYLSGNFAAALTMYEKALKIFEELGYRAEVARSLHQIGMIYQACKDYVAALAEYDKALKIKEELSDRTGMANSHFQIGQVLTQTGRCLEAFSHLLFALATLMELQSTNAEIVVEMFKVLRAKWGAENFDTAWQQATGEAVPEWLK